MTCPWYLWVARRNVRGFLAYFADLCVQHLATSVQALIVDQGNPVWTWAGLAVEQTSVDVSIHQRKMLPRPSGFREVNLASEHAVT
jgi:hypothetical protein